jgi:predicted MFS family arabinose efflux permease
MRGALAWRSLASHLPAMAYATTLDRIPTLSTGATLACGVACGAMVANIFYAQPLIGLIAPDLHLGAKLAGLIVTLTQLGYGAGLLLLVPLADRVENRRLVIVTLLVAAAALAAVALAPSAGAFLAASLALGFCSSGAQVVVPFAASLAPEATRGRTIGNVMAGLLTGIMLSRPLASLVAGAAGWRAVFWISAALMLALAVWLRRALPQRRPSGESYARILRSMGQILATTPAVRRRAVYQGLVFAIFNMFWTAAPVALTRQFGFGQRGIALFALAGAAGALAAPIAGRLGDRGHVRLGTGLALSVVAASMLLTGWAVALGSVIGLVVLAVALDGATQVNQVLGQRVIFSLPGLERGRLNAVYMAIVFALGGGGAAIATISYQAGGWWATAATGFGLGVLVLLVFASELRAARTAAADAA